MGFVSFVTWWLKFCGRIISKYSCGLPRYAYSNRIKFGLEKVRMVIIDLYSTWHRHSATRRISNQKRSIYSWLIPKNSIFLEILLKCQFQALSQLCQPPSIQTSYSTIHFSSTKCSFHHLPYSLPKQFKFLIFTKKALWN